MALKLGVSRQTMCAHLKQLGKVKKLDKWAPHELSDQQMFRRLEVCSSLLRRNETDPFLDRIVTVGEKWVLYDNRQRSWRWLDSDEPPRSLPSRLCTCERQCSLFFGPTSALFISNSSKLDNRSRLTIIAIWSACGQNPESRNPDRSKSRQSKSRKVEIPHGSKSRRVEIPSKSKVHCKVWPCFSCALTFSFSLVLLTVLISLPSYG
ncbi:hypothetical protein M513_02752 [Trichuris suis]|uniref:Uncharacterized protein n=1 Tax=Trichuris suis TaxID=68888 RepID=A0A085MGF1_9BILA|nr:hypothetical protein M513_02752 [Trichuris suis]